MGATSAAAVQANAPAAQPNAPAAQPNAPAAQPNAPAAQPNAPAAQANAAAAAAAQPNAATVAAPNAPAAVTAHPYAPAAAAPGTTLPSPATADPAAAGSTASTAVAVPDPTTWAARLLHEPLPQAAFLGRLVVVSQLDGDGSPQFFDLSAKALAAVSFFEVAAGKATAWSYKLNHHPERSDEGAKVRDLMIAGGADCVLKVSGKAPATLTLLRADNHANASVIAQAKADKMDLAHVTTALTSMLGYNGVVLAQDGDYILALAPTVNAATQLGRFALIVSDSANSYAVTEDNRRGAGFAQLVASKGRFAVLKIVSAKTVGSLPFATKLVIDLVGGKTPAPPAVNSSAVGATLNAP